MRGARRRLPCASLSAAANAPLLAPSLRPLARRLLDRLAGRALRLLAAAVKSDLGELSDYDGSEAHRGHRRLADTSQYAALESDMVFLGLTGLQDPPRPEARPLGVAVLRSWAGGTRRRPPHAASPSTPAN